MQGLLRRTATTADLGDLYNIPMFPDQQQPQPGNYANTIEDSVFSNLEPFTNT